MLVDHKKIKLSPSQMVFLGDVIKFFTDRGWSIFAAYGIAANIFAECSFRPHLHGDGGKAFGLCQWHYDRQQAFKKEYGRNMAPDATVEQQLAFIIWEMTKGGERKAGNLMQGVRTAREAGATFSRYYERPRLRDQEAAARGALAQAWFDQFVLGAANGQQTSPSA